MSVPFLFSGAVKQMRYLVSKDKVRLVDESIGVDLDLTYITPNIIAMGYPSQDILESTYRNTIQDCSRFLNTKHGMHYKVYNLTEGPYDGKLFDDRVEHYHMDDHHNPPLKMLLTILKSIDSWLKADSDNVVVIHCKAGRGRTGTIISSYLLWTKIVDNPPTALQFFAEKRSITNEGVEVPSQMRYVHYIYDIIKEKTFIDSPKKLKFEKILMKPIPSFTMYGECMPTLEIIDIETKDVLYRTPKYQWKLFGNEDACIILEPQFVVQGDILLRFYHQPTTLTKTFMKSSPMFRLCIHTSFIPELYLDIPKNQLDSMTQGLLIDNRFGNDFSIRLVFSNYSCDDLSESEFENIH